MGTKNYSSYSDLITFSRASTGTYLDSDGVLKSATTNTPRVEYDYQGNRLGLLVEEARTNVVLYSSDVAQSAWIKRGSASSQKIATDIFGNANSASRVSIGQSGINDFYESAYNTVRFSVSVAVSPSFYIKTITTTGTLSVQNAINGSTVGRWLIDLSLLSTTTYEHITETHPAVTVDVPFVSTTSGHGGLLFCSNTIDIISFDIDGIQLEQGSFPTSYIPTSGATATRSADVASIGVGAFGYNKGAGTVLMTLDSAQTANFPGAVAFNGNSGADRWYLYSSSGTWAARQFIDNVGTGTINLSAVEASAETKLALALKGSSASAVKDGGSVVNNATFPIPPLIDEMEIGDGPGGVTQLNGHISSIAYYPRRLTDAQIKALTSPPETPTLSLTFDDSSTSYLETSIHG